ncbi:deoxyguanosinetriphosphate triphosphohydrolase [Vibrio cyclitrophicus]|uniref:deoxyguanosinetriphosphate triphosphohydrolase n=1 Tax=Vibrio cyclitrophicus TaxID=47951 RepID=UPI0007EEF2B1|nr:deoxyguanosinetriphosphate triphosphohydrolase [Vibrio cyclitrophicus]OBT27982.1 deoxyguanosinetriphosphate triphosphohydrolase [Vibrio cyclitrophicus]
MDWNKLLSTKRYDQEVGSSGEESRSEFHKDYDKIVFSSAFRRLGRKTQVHPLANHDHIHTRLTHSIEVGSVGRSLGMKVGAYLETKDCLPEGFTSQEIGAIVQAACLAHDIGNPPFGHAGEYAIRQWFNENDNKLCLTSKQELNDLLIFEGNAQGLRVVSNIENNFNEGGLKLTYSTLGTLIKYPWFSDHQLASSKEKFNFFSAEKDFIADLANELGLSNSGTSQYSRHPLSYLMEAADDICYKILDIEDALELGMLRFEDVVGIFENLSGVESGTSQKIGEEHTPRRRIIPLRAKAIDNLINQCVAAFKNNYESIMSGNYSSELIKDIGELELKGVTAAKEITTNNIFLNQRKIELELGAYTILETILDAFITAVNELKSDKLSFKSQRVLDLMGANKIDKQSSYYECYLRVTDLVSGMTDNHATHIANQLSGRAL